MTYTVETTARFDREFKRLDRYTRWMIRGWIMKHIEGCENPYQWGKALRADRKGQWRYRIGDYRLICHIDEGRLIILALTVGHRRDIYRQ